MLESVSRLAPEILSKDELSLTSQARDLLSVHRKNEDLINLGAYQKGANPRIDRSIELHPRFIDLLKQDPEDLSDRASSFNRLKEVFT